MQEVLEITIDLEKAAPVEYANMINEIYKKALSMGISRMDDRWGVFSGKMNRVLRTRISENPKFIDVFNYWMLKSNLLDLEFNKPFLWRVERAKIKKMIGEVRKHIDKED